MTVESLISKLQKYPPHFEQEVLLECPETGDLTCDDFKISHAANTKVVNIELMHQLIHE